ncbi:MAG: phage major capsid protein [Patescibacteria group bacterium]|nr:phage major capsid protein [Patescibacteria group bacterium]
MAITPTYANSANQIAALKELYTDDKEYMKDLVYKENPFLALVPKNESPDGFAGKYIPVPLEYGTPQGRSHSFSNAQSQQTATQLASFFVYVIEDYQLVTITNLLMEQTKTNAGAFVDAAKLQMDGGFRNLTNNIAFELFGDGTATRGITTSASSQTGANPNVVTLPLSNANQIVAFEVGMLLVASSSAGGAIGTTGVIVTGVDRAAGVITGNGITLSTGANVASLDANFAIGTGAAYLTVYGDLPTAGASSTSSYLALSGLAAWIPKTTPASNDSFWGVNRSADPTRLAGLRYDASAYTIEEGMTNALAFLNREGGKPDLCVMDFASYAALVNALGAKVQYVQVNHDEVEVAFEGITFQSAYGRVTVLADRSCPPQTAYLLTMSTWKLRSLGKVPHILTYGMEGLEGLRVGNADALEIRIGYYGNLICSAPGWNCVVTLSA